MTGFSKKLVFVLLGCFFLLSACSSAQLAPAKSAPENNSNQSASAQPVDPWKDLKEAARKEGEVVVITSAGGNIPQAIVREWNKQNFGVDLKLTSMKGPPLREKMNSERKAGLYIIDALVFGAETLVNVVKESGWLDPMDEGILILPEVKDPAQWYESRLPYVDKEKTIFSLNLSPKPPITLNTKLIPLGEVKSYQDLLKPEYKGKIVISDPRMSGTGGKWFNSMLVSGMLDRAYFEKLKEQLAPISKDDAIQAQWVGQGKYPVGIALSDVEVLKLREAGATLEMITPSEGTYMTSGSGQASLVNKAPHPNAAKLFLNWLLTKDVQTVIAPLINQQSLRLDVPPTGFAPDKIRQPGVKYFNAITVEAITQAPKSAKLAEEIFGSLK